MNQVPPRAASLTFPDFSRVDIPGLWYKFRSFDMAHQPQRQNTQAQNGKQGAVEIDTGKCLSISTLVKIKMFLPR